MWQRLPAMYSRQAQVERWSRGSQCTCHAKRYVPSRHRKSASDGSNMARKLSTPEPTDPDDMLRELNSGGVGWLKDEENDWGLDEVAKHAKARQQQQLMHGFGSSGSPASRGVGDDSAGRRRGRGRGRGDTASDAQGSPIESGLASIATEEELYDSDMAAANPPEASGSGEMPPPARTREDLATPVEGMKRARTTVELEASYARRNPEVVEALRLRGVAVRVRQFDIGEVDDDLEAEGAGGSSLDLHDDDFDFSDEDDSLDLQLKSDLASAEDDDGNGASSSSSSRSKGNRGGYAGLREASGSREWYGGLVAAGFSVCTNAAGEVFLERTVRRKPTAAAAATPAAPATSTKEQSRAAAGSTTNPAATATAPPQPLVPSLEPISGRPTIVAALQRLSSPQQVLHFLELSYPQWAANGYRLVDMRSGRPVAAPSPAEAAHCLRALAITARRAEIGGWRCLELAAGRQAQGLAEALRVTPPRLLPEQAVPQLTAAYFDAARRFWLDSAAELIIDDPRVSWTRPAAASAAAAATGGREGGGGPVDEPRPERLPDRNGETVSAGTEATASAGTVAKGVKSFEGLSTRASPPDDPVYDSLLAKYTAVSRFRKLKGTAVEASQRPLQPPQPQPGQPPVVNGHPVPAVAEAVVARTDGTALAALRAELQTAVMPAAVSGPAGGAAEAALRRAAKIECLVSALWGMSSLGGPPYFQAETEAAVTILVRCLSSARPAPPPPLPSSSSSPPASAAAAAAALGAAAPGGLTGWQAGQMLWALGNSRHVTPRLADLESSILRSGGLPCMQPRDVTRVLWGFASLSYRPDRLLLTIRPDWSWRERTAAAADAEGDRQREVPAASPASGRIRRGKARTKGGKGAGVGSLHGDVRDFSAQQLAGAVWALAAMEQVDTGPFRSAWAQLLRRAAEVPTSEPVLTQIWQANLALHLESSATPPASSASSSALPASCAPSFSGRNGAGGAGGAWKKGGGNAAEDLTASGLAAAAAAAPGGGALNETAARVLLLRARDVFLAATSGLRRKVQSGYQRQIANTLTGLRLMHLLEDNSAGYSIDITLPQLRIALEADGPTHTSRTPGGAMLGATAMKRRHLQRMGWHVVNVTYKEWDKLTSESARRTFLQGRINEALVSRIHLVEGDGEHSHEGGVEASVG